MHFFYLKTFEHQSVTTLYRSAQKEFGQQFQLPQTAILEVSYGNFPNVLCIFD